MDNCTIHSDVKKEFNCKYCGKPYCNEHIAAFIHPSSYCCTNCKAQLGEKLSSELRNQKVVLAIFIGMTFVWVVLFFRAGRDAGWSGVTLIFELMAIAFSFSTYKRIKMLRKSLADLKL